jgi:uncharacterized protein (TIGR02996 family)
MSENPELLSPCLDAPADLQRLLVYAEWLEEHGDARARLARCTAAVQRFSAQRASPGPPPALR